MSKSQSLLEVLCRAIYSSYILIYAFELNQHSQKHLPIVQNNLIYYLSYLQFQHLVTSSPMKQYLTYYCQFLVLVSVCILGGLRFGKALGWICVISILLLTWNKTELLFIGTHILLIPLIV